MTPKFKVGDKLWYERFHSEDQRIFIIRNITTNEYIYDIYNINMKFIQNKSFSIKDMDEKNTKYIVRKFTKLDEVLL